MARITGVGGVFFKSKGDSAALAAWCRKHLGMPLQVCMDHGPRRNKVELWEPKVWDDKSKGVRERTSSSCHEADTSMGV